MRKRWNINQKQRNVLGAVAAVLMLAVAFRIITERAFLAQASIEGAFSLLHPEKSTGTVTVTGRYLPPPYGFSEEKLLKHFGEQIGLTVDGELRTAEFEGRRELIYEKTAAEADSALWQHISHPKLPIPVSGAVQQILQTKNCSMQTTDG